MDSIKNFRAGVLPAALLSLVLPGLAQAATVLPPFDATYTIYSVDSASGANPVPGIPSPYAAITFAPGDPDTLWMSGYSFHTGSGGSAAIYAVGVTRDVNHHINGFLGNASQLALAPGLPGNDSGIGQGLQSGSGGVTFYTSPIDNSLGMIKSGGGGPYKQIDLSALATPLMPGAGTMAFVPTSFAGAGRLKLVSNNGEFYDTTLAPDGAGTYDIASVTAAGKLLGIGINAHGDNNVPVGLAYVANGNDQFPQQSLLAASCDFNTGVGSGVMAYSINGSGNPRLNSARNMVQGLCPDGAAVDPVTGDILFTTYYGYPALYVLTGFTVRQATTDTISLAASASSMAENGGSVTVTANLSTPATTSTTVQLAFGGTAQRGKDYTLPKTQIVIPPGGVSGSRTITSINDSIYEGDETILVSIGGITGTATAGVPSNVIVKLLDDDPQPTVTLGANQTSITEAAGTVMLTATLSNPSSSNLVVQIGFAGTATRGRDYSVPKTAITIPAGSLSGSITLTAVDDTIHEGNETIISSISGISGGAAVGSPSGATVTIIDND